tara:strand:- start:117 stop:449 length:333 start_codon:yes stop_codon:yes gene_type:complete
MQHSTQSNPHAITLNTDPKYLKYDSWMVVEDKGGYTINIPDWVSEEQKINIMKLFQKIIGEWVATTSTIVADGPQKALAFLKMALSNAVKLTIEPTLYVREIREFKKNNA